jgi:hypothetical protein
MWIEQAREAQFRVARIRCFAIAGPAIYGLGTIAWLGICAGTMSQSRHPWSP